MLQVGKLIYILLTTSTGENSNLKYFSQFYSRQVVLCFPLLGTPARSPSRRCHVWAPGESFLQIERTNFAMETNSDLHLFGHVSGMAAEEEPHRVVPVPSPHPSSLLEAGSSSLLELTPEKPPPVRGRRSRTGRPVRLKQHDFSDVRTPTGQDELPSPAPCLWPSVCFSMCVECCNTFIGVICRQ